MTDEVRYLVLRDLLHTLGELETRLAETAEHVENADVLRSCADSLQAVREAFWLRWLEASSQHDKDGVVQP